MRAGWTRRRVLLWFATAGVIALFAVPMVPAMPGQLAVHVVCTSRAVAQETLWTPILLLNSPYEGSATGTYSVRVGGNSETMTMNASDGAAAGLFRLENWTVSRQVTEWAAGPGINHACTAPYRAEGTYQQSYYVTAPLVANGSASDVNETAIVTLPTPEVIPWRPPTTYGSVLFDNSFVAPDRPPIDSCSVPAYIPAVLGNAATQSIEVWVPVGSPQNATLIAATIPSDLTFSYALSGSFAGLLEQESTPSGGLAFEWASCR